MAWFKVDDKLHSHHKVRKAGKAALGLWVLAGSWCMDNDHDGFVPADIIKTWGATKSDAQKLVDAGFWREATYRGEKGWRFHDWAHFQPSAAVTAAKKAKEREAGLRGNHQRWHVDRGIVDPDCDYCHRVPEEEPDRVPDGVGDTPPESPPNRPVPVPDPEPHVSSDEETTSALVLVEKSEAVDRLCLHLADRIEANGSKRPTITAKWRDAARLMLERDKRTEEDVHRCIDWCQSDDFWRANVLSMPKLREKYDQLRLAAQRTNAPKRGDINWDAAFARAASKTEGA